METTTQTTQLPVLEQYRQERQAMEKATADFQKAKRDLEEMKGLMELSGHTQAGQAPTAKKEVSAREYANAALRGKILE